MPARVDPETCIGCEACVDVCPVSAIEMQEDVAVVDEETCTECGDCVETCPVDAITLETADSD